MPVLGIDIGTSDCYVAAIRQGSVEIVRNDVSERKTASLVGYTEKKRSIGMEAAAEIKGNYRNTCRNIKHLLGLKVSDHRIQKEHFFQVCKLDKSDVDHETVGFSVEYQGKNHVFSAAEVAASLMEKLKLHANQFTGYACRDVVISVPSYFDSAQRQAMLDAASIANLNCLRVINDSSAIALAHGLYRVIKFKDDEESVIAFISIGHSHFNCTLVKYAKCALTILSDITDVECGGRDINKRIMEHLVLDALKAGKHNPLDSAKSRYRLEEGVDKLKKILSANNDATVSLECLCGDQDFTAKLTRSELEEICEPLRERMENVMFNALKEANMTKEVVNAVEIVGGLSRIPFLQKLVGNFFEKSVSRTLDADECVSRGCALNAAMLSPLFKLPAFDMKEFSKQGFILTWEKKPNDIEVNANSEVYQDQEQLKTSSKNFCEVFPVNSPLNVVKLMSFYRREPFELNAEYAAHPTKSVKQKNFNSILSTYRVNLGIQSETKKIKVRTKLNYSGIFNIESAAIVDEYEVDVTERRRKQRKADGAPCQDEIMPQASETQKSEKSIEMDDGQKDIRSEANANVPEKQDDMQENENMETDVNEFEEVVVGKEKKVTRTELQLECLKSLGFGETLLQKLKYQEKKMKEDDDSVQDTEKAKNDIETYIFESRNLVESKNSKWYPFLTDLERERLLTDLTDAEDWIFGDEDVSKSECFDKLKKLHVLGDLAEQRLKEKFGRDNEIKMLEKTIERCRAILDTHDVEKIKSVPSDLLSSFNKNIAETQKWLLMKMQEQNKKKDFEEPNIKIGDVKERTKDLDKLSSQFHEACREKTIANEEEMKQTNSVDGDTFVSPEKC